MFFSGNGSQVEPSSAAITTSSWTLSLTRAFRPTTASVSGEYGVRFDFTHGLDCTGVPWISSIDSITMRSVGQGRARPGEEGGNFHYSIYQYMHKRALGLYQTDTYAATNSSWKI